MISLKEIPREVWRYCLAIVVVLALATFGIMTTFNDPKLAEAISKPRFDVWIMVGSLIIAAVILTKYGAEI